MNNLSISKYTKLLEVMSLESKIELLSILTESIKQGLTKKKVVDKAQIAKDLFGTWADIDDNITDLIYSSRTTSDRDISFD